MAKLFPFSWRASVLPKPLDAFQLGRNQKCRALTGAVFVFVTNLGENGIPRAGAMLSFGLLLFGDEHAGASIHGPTEQGARSSG